MADIAERLKEKRGGKRTRSQKTQEFDCEFAASARKSSPKRTSVHMTKEAVQQLEQVVGRRASVRLQRPSIPNPALHPFFMAYQKTA
jgi:hypothetical protein